MLGFWPLHADYQRITKDKLASLVREHPVLWNVLSDYRESISKLFILNLDPLKRLMAPLFSPTGRPSKYQAEIFRAFVMMNDLHLSLDIWIKRLPFNLIWQAACGFTGALPGVASYYDFIDRIIKLDESPCVKPKKRKPRKKVGKGKKLPPRRPGSVQRMADRILSGRRFDNRPERLLQEIFAAVAVQPSVELGLIPRNVSVSGDGTCIITGASPYGVKVCGCKTFACDCDRRFSDPNATWGWDSHKDQWFYGYTGYFMSFRNTYLKLDLPLYLRLVEARRHDGISAVVALSEFRDLYPNLKLETFISDSASDNYATYDLLKKWNINAVIALNDKHTGNRKYTDSFDLNDNGVPLCRAGLEMVFWGNCANRSRLKWRCPKACGKSHEGCVNCSNTDYGRVVYTKPDWDIRLFTAIPRGSDRFKALMRDRTTAERVNNRILNDYGVERSRMRGKKRTSFMTTIAAINIHLDAQLQYLSANSRFDFSAIFASAS